MSTKNGDITIACLYNKRQRTAIDTIDHTLHIKRTNETNKLMNSSTNIHNKNVTNPWFFNSNSTGMNDIFDDFFKYCCICVVRKRKTVGNISPSSNLDHTKYHVNYENGLCGIPVIQYLRSTQDNLVIQ